MVLKTTDNENLECEVNFSEDPEVSECKVIRFRIGERVFNLKREELVSFLMAIGTAKDQKDLLPIRVKNVKRLERRLHSRFKATKDYRAGEIIEVVMPWIDEVPTEDEILSGNLNNRKTKLFP